MKSILKIIAVQIVLVSNLFASPIAEIALSNIPNIDGEKVESIYIVNSISIKDDNGQKKEYLDQDMLSGIYSVIFETDQYVYFTQVLVNNNQVKFYYGGESFKRIKKSFMGDNFEEVSINDKNEVTETNVIYDDADIDITGSQIIIDSNDILYTYNLINNKINNITENTDDLVLNRIRASYVTILKEDIEEVYLSTSCKLINSNGEKKFPFDDLMNNNIYQVIFQTENYFYILKVQEITNSVFKYYTDLEPIKRISRNLIYDDITESIFLDEYNRVTNIRTDNEDADNELTENSFTLEEANNKVVFKITK